MYVSTVGLFAVSLTPRKQCPKTTLGQILDASLSKESTVDQTSIDNVLNSQNSRMFSQDNMLANSGGGTGNNYATAMYGSLGNDLFQGAEDRMRKQTESCDNLSVIKFIFSLSGGTGSGLGNRLISRFRETWPEKLLCANVLSRT